MPGSSLWLIPPSNSVFNRQLQTQITSLVPTRFKGHKTVDFIPHVTITSNIDAAVYGADGQAWLDSLPLSSSTSNTEPVAAPATSSEQQTSGPVIDPLDEKAALERGEQAASVPSEIEAEQTATVPAEDKPDGPLAEAMPIEVDLHSVAAGEAFFRKLTLLAKKPSPGLQALAVVCRTHGVYKGDFQAGRSWEVDEYEPHLSLMYAELPKKDVQKMIPAVMQDLERARAIVKPKRDGTVAQGGQIVLVPTDRPIDQWKPIASRELPAMVWKWTGT